MNDDDTVTLGTVYLIALAGLQVKGYVPFEFCLINFIYYVYKIVSLSKNALSLKYKKHDFL